VCGSEYMLSIAHTRTKASVSSWHTKIALDRRQPTAAIASLAGNFKSSSIAGRAYGICRQGIDVRGLRSRVRVYSAGAGLLSRRTIELIACGTFGAEEGTRTPTPLRVRGPEPRASANSATSALETAQAGSAERAAILSLANALCGVKSPPPTKWPRHAGVFTRCFSIATAFAMRFCRVSSFFASSIHFTYSLRCV
jgi:hypothetical protein